MSSSVDVRLPVEHVSDTAYLVALCRAEESARPDAKFNDPYAAILAEPKAAELHKRLPTMREFDWLMTARTCLIDRHIQNLVAGGVDTVVNLAAGLDTRPYRLDLPADLRWVEADFPEITAYKTARLQEQKPKCRLERAMIDLSDEATRRAFLSRLDRDAKQTLIITEGLLMYLTQASVDGLAKDLSEMPSARWWIMDYQPPAFFSWTTDRMKVDEVAPEIERKVRFDFMTEEGTRYFERFGWRTIAFDSFEAGSRAFGREVPAEWLPTEGASRAAFEQSGIALLAR